MNEQTLKSNSSNKADFASKQEVRWCPGCGDYAILAAVQKVMPELGIPRENIVFISGIGCSGRFPYYMNTYGFHTIHGRAPAVATGLKLVRPDLSVWVITGDGDGLSIGANHLLHAMRRNIDIKILLFNNQIYGLTKGQYSPTSELGKITATTPHGSLDQPVDAVALALTAGATFVARVLDIDMPGLQRILKAAAQHQGAAFIEIYQNCNIFNDKAFAHLSEKANRQEHTLWLEHGKPLIFGTKRDLGIRLCDFTPQILSLQEAEQAKEVTVFDAQQIDGQMAYQLCRLHYPEYPVAFGIFRQIQKASYEQSLALQMEIAKLQHGPEQLKDLLKQGHVWEVKA